jgi:type I restriction enzyme, S subunit
MSKHTIWDKHKIGELIQPIRKSVDVQMDRTYREIGIRSHGKGIFYKNEVLGQDLGNKRVFWVEPGCFVVNIVFAWEQAVAKTTDAERGMIASHRFPIYRPVNGKVDLDYLLYFFNTPHGKHLLELASPGGAGRNKTLGQQAFLDLAIPIPSIEEQRKIAEILSTWDEAIRLTQELIAAKQQRKKGLMQRLLTGQVRFKEFGERPWRELTIGKIGEVSSGGTPSTNSPEFWNGEISWVTPTEITALTTPYLHKTKRKITETGLKSSSARLLSSGSIIVCTRATVGACAITKIPVATNQGFKNITLKRDFDSGFIYHWLVLNKNRLLRVASGSTFLEVSKQDFINIKLRVPEHDEQRRVAAVLQACDEEIQLHQQKLAALQQQKKGLMQRLLTGQLRVCSTVPGKGRNDL